MQLGARSSYGKAIFVHFERFLNDLFVVDEENEADLSGTRGWADVQDGGPAWVAGKSWTETLGMSVGAEPNAMFVQLARLPFGIKKHEQRRDGAKYESSLIPLFKLFKQNWK